MLKEFKWFAIDWLQIKFYAIEENVAETTGFFFIFSCASFRFKVPRERIKLRILVTTVAKFHLLLLSVTFVSIYEQIAHPS